MVIVSSAALIQIIIIKKPTCEVAVHFNKEKHQLFDFEFIVIKQICNIDDKHNISKVLLLQERHFGVPNNALFNLMASTKDRSLILGGRQEESAA